MREAKIKFLDVRIFLDQIGLTPSEQMLLLSEEMFSLANSCVKFEREGNDSLSSPS